MHAWMQERDGSFNVRAVLPQHAEEERESHTIHRDCSQSRLPSAFESASSRGTLCLTPPGCVAQRPSFDAELWRDYHIERGREATISCDVVSAMAMQESCAVGSANVVGTVQVC